MRVALVEPRSADINVFSKFPLPRLGLPIIGTILRDAGHDVRIYCEDLRPLHPRDYWHILSADLIGISSITSTAPRAYFLGSLFRRAKKRVVIGGVHATYMPDEALQHADYCVRGEGEHTMLQLVEALGGRGRLEDIPGLSFRQGETVHHNPPRPLEKTLATFPNPDLSLINGHTRLWCTPVITSRGCPYNCNFCSVTSMFGARYRCLDPEQTVAALEPHKNGYVFIYDDNFTANKRRAKDILRLMIKRRIMPQWTAQARADVARDPELVSLMARARCRALCIGFESINPSTLESMNKKQSVDDIVRCIKVLRSHKVSIHGMFVVGADADSPATIKETVAFAKANRIDTVQFSILTPLPGTPLFQQLDSEGRIFSKNWSLYDGHHVVFWPKKMSPIELQLATYQAMRSFYSWTHCLRAMCRLDFVTAILRSYGVRGVKQWKRSNKDFLAWLKAPAVSHALSQAKGRAKGLLRKATTGLPAAIAKHLATGRLIPTLRNPESSSDPLKEDQ